MLRFKTKELIEKRSLVRTAESQLMNSGFNWNYSLGTLHSDRQLGQVAYLF